MLPFMAQGAAQAIEDGATLAACLKILTSMFRGVSGLRRIAKTENNHVARAIPGPFQELPSA